MADTTSTATMHGGRHAAAGCRRSAQWADKQVQVAAGRARRSLLILALSIYPLLFSLVVSFINYDFQVPGHAFVGLQEFRARRSSIRWRAGRWCVTALLSGASVLIEFFLGLADRADHGAQLPRAEALSCRS